MIKREKVLTADSVSKLSFVRRLKFKVYDIIKPSIDPKIALFSRLEKQVSFFVILITVVCASVYLVMEYGY